MARSSYLAPILQSHPIRSAAHRRPAGVRPGATWKQRPGSHCRENGVRQTALRRTAFAAIQPKCDFAARRKPRRARNQAQPS